MESGIYELNSPFFSVWWKFTAQILSKINSNWLSQDLVIIKIHTATKSECTTQLFYTKKNSIWWKLEIFFPGRNKLYSCNKFVEPFRALMPFVVVCCCCCSAAFLGAKIGIIYSIYKWPKKFRNILLSMCVWKAQKVINLSHKLPGQLNLTHLHEGNAISVFSFSLSIYICI